MRRSVVGALSTAAPARVDQQVLAAEAGDQMSPDRLACGVPMQRQRDRRLVGGVVASSVCGRLKATGASRLRHA